MTSMKNSAPLRRFILPALCLGLCVFAATQGEVILVEQAGIPAMGPLVAIQVAALVSVAFGLLAVITFLLAIFPGKENVGEEDEDTYQVPPEIPAQDRAAADKEAAERERSSEQIITALQRSATREANARLEADKRCEEASVLVAELQERIESFVAGTAPEIKAMESAVRDEAKRDALRQIQDLAAAADRRAEALKAAKARVEADLAAAQESLRVKDEELDAVPAHIATARQEAATDEYQRIKIAVDAINESTIDFHDTLQREAVQRHADRVREAINRLDPTAAPDFVSHVSMPPLSAPTESGPRLDDGNDVPSKRRGFGRRRKTE